MIEAVLDASVVLKWFRTPDEHHVAAARALRSEYEAGELLAFAPALLFIEILNVAGRRWHLPEQQLDALASALPRLGLQLVEPDLSVIARWINRGLTAYDAAYLAVAEQTGARLITDAREILHAAPDLSSPLAEE